MSAVTSCTLPPPPSAGPTPANQKAAPAASRDPPANQLRPDLVTSSLRPASSSLTFLPSVFYSLLFLLFFLKNKTKKTVYGLY